MASRFVNFGGLAAAVLLLGCHVAMGAGFGKEVTTVGPWHVFKSSDAMTDEVSCVAIYRDNMQVQLSADTFAIGLEGRGGVRGYKIRIDDKPAGDLQLATDIEQDISAALFQGRAFEELLEANRVRFQAITVLSTLVDEDLDFSNVKAVIDVLRGPSCK